MVPPWTNSQRIHIPIIVPENVVFDVAGKKIPLKEGYVFEFNNKQPHYVENKSTQDRVHLIIDYSKSKVERKEMKPYTILNYREI